MHTRAERIALLALPSKAETLTTTIIRGKAHAVQPTCLMDMLAQTRMANVKVKGWV